MRGGRSRRPITHGAKKIAETTSLHITLHLPYSDLNLASMNQPIWEETVRQMKACLTLGADFATLAVVHPGHLSPLGAQLPDAAWEQNVLGIQQICDHAADLSMTIGVENMVNMPALGQSSVRDNRDNGYGPRNLGFVLDVSTPTQWEPRSFWFSYGPG